jgi:hypothetical protein
VANYCTISKYLLFVKVSKGPVAWEKQLYATLLHLSIGSLQLFMWGPPFFMALVALVIDSAFAQKAAAADSYSALTTWFFKRLITEQRTIDCMKSQKIVTFFTHLV